MLSSGATRFALLGSAYDPRKALGSDLVAWLDADSHYWAANGGMTDDGDGVLSSWRDIAAGFDFTAAAAARPTFSATSFVGGPGVTFDGTANAMTCATAGLLALLAAAAAASEIWVLAQNDAVAGARMFASYGAGNTVGRGVGNAATTARAFTGFDNGGTPATQTTDFGTFNTRAVLRTEFDETETTGTLNGVAGTPSSVIPATTVARARVGAGSGAAPANFGLGVVKAVLWTRPTGPKAAGLQAWLAGRKAA